MIVIADTTPLNYLILIREINILSRLYGRVVIPTAVHEELMRVAAPSEVRTWVANPPPWLDVRSPTSSTLNLPPYLGAGARDAIALAEDLHADLLIVDDMPARREAKKRGLSVIGTLGVLREAAEEGYLDLRAALERLQLTSFHVSPKLIAYLLGQSE